MANALQQNLLQLKSRVQNGPVGQFFGWWVEELKQALPQPWQETLQHAMRRLAVEVRDGSLVLAAGFVTKSSIMLTARNRKESEER